MKYEIVIARHGSPLYIVSADSLKDLVKESNECVKRMAEKGEETDSLECVWQKFPDEETDDILMTWFSWEMQ